MANTTHEIQANDAARAAAMNDSAGATGVEALDRGFL
jgi:hypothetical protein